MIRKLPQTLLLAGWLLATGTQWDLLQVFAWSRMFAGYARTMPTGDALQRTFEPTEMCTWCRAVQAATKEQAEARAVLNRDEGKAPLFLQSAPATVVVAPECSPTADQDDPPLELRRDAPPGPPPRGTPT